AIDKYITNRLDNFVLTNSLVAGIIGDSPSQYSKSPTLWNAAFRHLNLDAIYLAFDVTQAQVGGLLGVLKTNDRFLGVNVTVPHKVHVMSFLDDLDPGAKRIEAVNTIVRTCEQRLVGHNTDGAGFIDSILQRQPDSNASFVPALSEMNVLLLGAGGSARAVAFHVADRLGKGRLFISNRTFEHAASLAADINRNGGAAEAITEADISKFAPTLGLIINSTTKGQGGLCMLANDRATMLEPYSALAPANPPALAREPGGPLSVNREWMDAASSDIDSNHQASFKLAQSIPSNARFYDLIYHPQETVFLRHGRLTGHPTMNGKAMIINQAAIAFCRGICAHELHARRIDTRKTYDKILGIMYRAW
ncbi:MAG: shikimate dehydrogenase family protein, partial [Candidatus Binatia bacterium]